MDKIYKEHGGDDNESNTQLTLNLISRCKLVIEKACEASIINNNEEIINLIPHLSEEYKQELIQHNKNVTEVLTQEVVDFLGQKVDQAAKLC